jgi:O-antigen ligase
MILSSKSNIFLLFFAFFQILIFFSLSTGYEFIVLSLFVAFLLFYFWFFRLKIVFDTKIALLWMGLILFLLISSIFTHSLPLSLDAMIFHILSVVIFIFFRSLGESKIISKSDLTSTFLLVGLVLSAFFIVFFSFPDLSEFLPAVNIFTTKHGHSHFAALLLMLIPLGWWFSFSGKHKFFHYKGSVLVLFYVLLVFTFGRFSIFLSLLQLPFIYQFVKKEKIKKIYLCLVGAILIFTLIVVGIFSKNSSENCAVHEFRSQICKPISKEVRPEYLKQSWLSFKSYPLFGYGPGTFSLITKKFNVIAQYSSVYAHNVFIQIFSESGLFVGIIYVFLIFFLYKNMMSIFKIKNLHSENYFIFLGLVSLLLNSLMDFDWNLFAIYQMTIIFIAVILWDYQQHGYKEFLFKTDTFIKFIWLILTALLVFLGFINILTKLLILKANDNLAFTIFPYFYSQSNYFLKDGQLAVENRKSMYKLYRNHSKFLIYNIDQLEEPEAKKSLYSRLLVVSPREYINIEYYELLKGLNDYETLGLVSYEGLNLLSKFEDQGFLQKYESKIEIAGYLFWAANQHIKNGDFESAIVYYKDILVVQKWAFHVNTPVFLEAKGLRSEDVMQFLKNIDVGLEDFGKNRKAFEVWLNTH